MAKYKHLDIEQRTTIKEMLDKRCSFTEIGKAIDKDPSTVSKEIRNHLVYISVEKISPHGQLDHPSR